MRPSLFDGWVHDGQVCVFRTYTMAPFLGRNGAPMDMDMAWHGMARRARPHHSTAPQAR